MKSFDVFGMLVSMHISVCSFLTMTAYTKCAADYKSFNLWPKSVEADHKSYFP